MELLEFKVHNPRELLIRGRVSCGSHRRSTIHDPLEPCLWTLCVLQVHIEKLLRRKKDEFIPLFMSSRTIELWTAIMAAERPEEIFGRVFWTAVMRGLSDFCRGNFVFFAVEGNFAAEQVTGLSYLVFCHILTSQGHGLRNCHILYFGPVLLTGSPIVPFFGSIFGPQL